MYKNHRGIMLRIDLYCGVMMKNRQFPTTPYRIQQRAQSRTSRDESTTMRAVEVWPSGLRHRS